MEHPAYTLAALCTVGGLGGFVRRGSVPSLVAGVGIGALYAYSGKLLQENADGGIQYASAASASLLSGSAPRASKSRKPMPIASSVSGISASAYYGKKYSDFYL